MLAALYNAHSADVRHLARQGKARMCFMRRMCRVRHMRRFGLLVIVHAYFPFVTVTGLSA